MFWWLEICWELIDNKTTENLVCKFKFESTQEQVRTFQQHVLSQSFHQTFCHIENFSQYSSLCNENM